MYPVYPGQYSGAVAKVTPGLTDWRTVAMQNIYEHMCVCVCMYVCMYVCVCVGGGGGGTVLRVLQVECTQCWVVTTASSR